MPDIGGEYPGLKVRGSAYATTQGWALGACSSAGSIVALVMY